MRSQSTQPDGYGYGVDEFGSFEVPGRESSVEVEPFDERQFLADLGFGISIPARAKTPEDGGSEAGSDGDGSPVRVKGKSPARGTGQSPASVKGKSPASAKHQSPSNVKAQRDRPPSPGEEEASDGEDESTPPSPVKRRLSAPVRQPLAGTSAPRQSLPAPPTRAQTPPPVRPTTPVRSVPQTSPPAQVTRRVTIREPDPIPKSTIAAKPPSSAPKSSTPIDKPSILGSIIRSSPPARGPIARARAPSPLQRQVQAAPPPPPPAAVPAPAHIAATLGPKAPESPIPTDASPKPVLKTRRRARPMGSSVAGSVVSGYGRYAGSVVSGYDREGSVVSGYDGGSVVSGYDDDRSVVSGADDKSVVSERMDAESEVGAVRPPVTLPPALQLRALELMSPLSDAPSSVVTPLSPGIVQALHARGIEVDEPIAEERDEDAEAIAQHLAGMNLQEVLGSPEPISIEIMGRVDTDSGFTSPIAPAGAPSDTGSLFSRAMSPKPRPAISRLSTIRAGTPASTRTKTPPVTP
ncbi:hypothetical protein RSAG8_03674, partial [Rhizoctonia solani AG-8 WAC10335]